MGLAICRKIVDRHRGSITVDGQLGRGAAFRINLHVRQSSEEPGYEQVE